MGFGPVSAAGRLALAELDREDAAHADAVNVDGRSPPIRSRDGNRHDSGGGPARTSTGQDEEAGNEKIGAWGTRIRRRTQSMLEDERCEALLDLKQRRCTGSRASMVRAAM